MPDETTPETIPDHVETPAGGEEESGGGYGNNAGAQGDETEVEETATD